MRRSTRDMVRLSRRTFLLAIALALLSGDVGAEESALPPGVQADLIAKTAAYDRNLLGRAHGRVRVLTIYKTDDSDSHYAATRLEKALTDVGTIAGLPLEQETLAYGGPDWLRSRIQEKGVAIVVVSSKLSADIPRIVSALEKVDVLSVGLRPEYIERRLVLGFDVVGGKPKLLIHLGQAKRQNVEFEARLLRLAKVFE